MPALVVIGSQWGDEGKGKLIDVLSAEADFVVRYQGGANAGHTLKVDQEELILHLIPSAVFHPKVKILISGGVVLDLPALYEEIQGLKKTGKLKGQDQRLLISDSSTLLLEQHKQLDQAREKQACNKKIGTTGKGIGPAYESRTSRKALLFRDLFQTDEHIKDKLEGQLKEINFLLKNLYHRETEPLQQTFEKLKGYQDSFKAYRCSNMPALLHQALQDNKKVLFEGAQGSLLDLQHGTYPYVTSSSTLAGGVLSSCGLGFSHFTKTLAITKAYTTRVGEGPFPTECMDQPAGLHLQKKGHEFGATTGRTRRCGWLDLPALKYSARINGVGSLALMKLDVLSGLNPIKVAVAYQIGSKRVEDFPVRGLGQSLGAEDFPQIRHARLERVGQSLKPIYKELPGWDEDLSQLKSKAELPKPALNYIDFISKSLGVPIDIISVGPERSQTFQNKKLF